MKGVFKMLVLYKALKNDNAMTRVMQSEKNKRFGAPHEPVK